MYKCFCNQFFKTKNSLSVHLTRTEKLSGLQKEELLVFTVYGKDVVNDLINQYKEKTICVDDIRKQGYYLGNYLSLLGIKRTNQEEKLTTRYLKKYETSCLTKYGIKNISQLNEVKQKKIKTHLTNYGNINNFNDPIIKEKAFSNRTDKMKDPLHRDAYFKKYKQTCKDKYNTDNVSKYKPIAKKISNTQKDKCSKLSLEQKRKMTQVARDYWSNQINWQSKIETKIQSLLNLLNINYLPHFSLYGYNYDIVINNHIIEINGDFWHANPSIYKADEFIIGNVKASDLWNKDDRKKNAALEDGKKYLVLWECDIISSTDTELINLLKSFIKS